MLTVIKECIDKHDFMGLRYIFLDSLDVDPTFETYQEDYNACKNMPGFFEIHEELHGIIVDKSRWDIKYWEQLKIDLMKNFSRERFEHMREVAKVVYADKIVRLQKERRERQDKVSERGVTDINGEKVREPSKSSKELIKKLREEEIRKAKENIRENININNKIDNKNEHEKQEKKPEHQIYEQEKQQRKKMKGIALVVLAIVLAIIVAKVILPWCNPQNKNTIRYSKTYTETLAENGER